MNTLYFYWNIDPDIRSCKIDQSDNETHCTLFSAYNNMYIIIDNNYECNYAIQTGY